MKKNMPNIKGESYSLGRIHADKVSGYSKGQPFRLGYMTGVVVASRGNWTIWWRRG